MSEIIIALANVDGKPTTTSLQVAQHFGKYHKNVLRDIENLIAQLPEGYELNFEPIQIEVSLGLGRKRTNPAYRMTRDGFALLAMGFTGAQALKWKCAYISAFNAMEASLHAQSTLISPAQAQELRELVQLIAASGKQGHGETWNRLHRKMGVNSYLQLPAEKFNEARAYLRGKMDGEALEDLARKHFPDIAGFDAFGLLDDALTHAQAAVESLAKELATYKTLAHAQLKYPALR